MDWILTGCIVIGDEGISQLFLMAVDAHNGGQDHIPVHVFPCRVHYLLIDNHALIDSLSENSLALREFQRNLQTGYDAFEYSARLPAAGLMIEAGIALVHYSKPSGRLPYGAGRGKNIRSEAFCTISRLK